MSAVRGAVVFVAAILLVTGCSRASSDATPTSTSTPTSTPTSKSPLRLPPPKPPPPPCRALAVTGPNAGLPAGAALTGPLVLLAGERVSVKEPASGREFALVGPAVATACDRDMHTRLTRGRFEGSRGGGEAPGADKWVVTPFGVVSYEASVVDVVVDALALRVTVKAGSAAVLLADAGPGEAWTIVTAAAPFVARGSDAGADPATRCADARAAEKTLDDSLADAGAAFGDLAEKAAAARRRARVACAVASLTGDAP